MSSTWRSTCSGIGWCCRSRRCPKTSAATGSCARSSIACRSRSSRCVTMTAFASAPERGLAPERVLQRLDWTVVRRLDGLLQGDYRTLFRGNGVDFADLRPYEYGDDVRNIDWNVTARMDAPYV